jgi:AcrR family transcriptional regulator
MANKAIKQRNPEQTRNRILTAALDLFAEKGYRATSIREIAAKADVNSALIQHYFNGKLGLLHEISKELLKGEFKNVFGVLQTKVSGKDDLKLRLHLFLDQLLQRSLEKWEALYVILNEVQELSQIEDNDFAQVSLSFVGELGRYLEASQKRGWISRKVDAHLAADHLFALALDQIRNWKHNREHPGRDISDQKTRQRWITQTLEIYLNGILADKMDN